ncbi:hypothetical protein A2U01_0057458 [Trifolium medium]|uniref:Uncharacterized protein n=1 Tax=Trifolium medium TaxID=97028 RepID=A0A392RL34_9FABA|nr:hypothetical protein [Trifolium medium]
MSTSSLRRKKPRREDWSWEEEERTATETEETEMVTWPSRVKPNFSKKIKERVSELMVRSLISAVVVVGERKRRRRTQM